jgi:hypothetical protein
MHGVNAYLKDHGHETKQMFLPFCTWDKFGDILANSGGRSIGLYDEVVSFFASMNMYSSSKLQVSDTKEYQDFLQLYTGKSKTRETGNVYVYSNLYLIFIHLFLLIRVRTCCSNLETKGDLQSSVQAC